MTETSLFFVFVFVFSYFLYDRNIAFSNFSNVNDN